jgi:hypothetical protein
MGVWEVGPLLLSCATPQDVEVPRVEAAHPRRFIQRSAWKEYSANFAQTAFSEVRMKSWLVAS